MSRRTPIATSEELDLGPTLRVFFPHSRKAYGTPAAEAAMMSIRKAWPGCTIIDPRRVDWKGLQKKKAGDPHDEILRDCDVVVGLEHGGFIGRGVFGGLSASLRLKLKTYVVRDGRLVAVRAVAVVDEEDWAYRYGRVAVESD